LDASTIARAARGARRPAALSRPETDAAADDDGRSCLANLPMAEILETGTRPEAASTRRAPLEHAGTARIEARDAISDVSLGFEPPQTRRGPDAPWRRSERRKGEGAHETSPPAVERIDARPTRGVHDGAVRRRMETRSALHAGRNAVPRTPLRGERWRRRGQHARLVGSADCALITSLADFFRGTAGSFGHKKRVDACFWSGNAESAGSCGLR
jgi:hypothetical protein